MAAAPLVSVIMPAYNAADYLLAAVASVMQQTVTDVEVVIVDDGSTDGTVAAAETAAQRWPGRVRVFQQQNQGVSAARNTAMSHARGQLFALLDSDDLWEPAFLETQLKTLQAQPAVDIVSGNARFLGGRRDGQPARPHPDPRPAPELLDIIADEAAVFVMSVFRRSVYERIGGFDPALKTNEDYEFWLRAALAGLVFARNSAPLASYRVRRESLSADQSRMLSGILVVYELVRQGLRPGSRELKTLERQMVRFEAELHVAALRAGQRAAATSSNALFLRECLRGRMKLKTAVGGILARYTPRLFTYIDGI